MTLRFTVRRNTFHFATLTRSLGLQPFCLLPTPVLSDALRIVIVDDGRGSMQEVTITCHALAEVATKAFDDFLKRAVDSYLGRTVKGALVKASELT